MLTVKPYRQKIAHCGPAALKMVLGYYAIERSERELAKISGCNLRSGTTAEGIMRAARRFGLKGYIRDGARLADIRRLVRIDKIPPIVDWFSVDEGHYSVVVDIDSANIWLQDPELGHVRSLRLDVFKRVWFDFPGPFIKNKQELVLRRLIALYR